jgi:hypothetical protein
MRLQVTIQEEHVLVANGAASIPVQMCVRKAMSTRR